MSKMRHLAVVFALACCTVPIMGCYDDYAVGAPVAEGYYPQYYDGYVVYYDGVGHPFYYVNGVQTWVPASSPYYLGYVNHWRAYGPAYNRWYAGYGYRYHGYYRGGGYFLAGVHRR